MTPTSLEFTWWSLQVWSLPDDLYRCGVYLMISTGVEFTWWSLQVCSLPDDLYRCGVYLITSTGVGFTWGSLQVWNLPDDMYRYGVYLTTSSRWRHEVNTTPVEALQVWCLPHDVYRCGVYLIISTVVEYTWLLLKVWSLPDDNEARHPAGYRTPLSGRPSAQIPLHPQ